MDAAARTDRAAVFGATIRFPLIVWAVWRSLHLLAIAVFGGSLIDSAFEDDGGWFLSVLRAGYIVNDVSYQTFQNTAFFPGLVWVTEPFTVVMPERAAAVLVANIFGLLSFIGVWLAMRAWIDVRAANRAVIGLALWPSSFFLWAFYSEGMLVAATALGLLAVRRRSATAATVMAFAAASARVVGVFFGPIVGLALLWRRRRLDAMTIGLFVGPTLALGLVMLQQHVQAGDALSFTKAHEAWGRGVSWPWSPFVDAGEGIIDKFPSPAFELSLNLAGLLVVLVALIAVLRRRKSDTELLWGFAAWLAPLFSAVVSSQIRFVLAAWPALAALVSRRISKPMLVGLAVIGTVVSLVLLHRFASGEFVA